MLTTWPGNWTRLDCGWVVRRFGAAPSPAAARNSASSRSRRQKASPAGSWKNWKNGCPNSCGQHWIADIGIDGKKMKVDGRLVDAYYFCLGGALGLHQGTARPVGYRCLATQVPDAIERLLRQYLTAREAGENLRQFFARHKDAELREFLAGEPVDAVTRDLPPVSARGTGELAQIAGGDGD